MIIEYKSIQKAAWQQDKLIHQCTARQFSSVLKFWIASCISGYLHTTLSWTNVIGKRVSKFYRHKENIFKSSFNTKVIKENYETIRKSRREWTMKNFSICSSETFWKALIKIDRLNFSIIWYDKIVLKFTKKKL